MMMVLVLVAFVPACGPSYLVEGPGSYSHEGIMITPILLDVRGDKLRVRLNVVNHTEEEVVVDRNQMQLVLPDGQVVGRFTGKISGMTSGVHRIPAGTSHRVFMDFMIEGGPPSEVRLQLTGVIQGGKPMDLPDYELTISE